jgi:hypothetical protein
MEMCVEVILQVSEIKYIAPIPPTFLCMIMFVEIAIRVHQ